MGRKVELRNLDREMNRALKDANGPAEAMSIRREFALRRRQLLTGVEVSERPIEFNGMPYEIRIDMAAGPSFNDLCAIATNELRRLGNQFDECGRVHTFRIPEPRSYNITFEAVQEDLRRLMESIAGRGDEKWNAAKQRAEEFLLSHLNDEQKAMMKAQRYFIVVNKSSGRRWRIRTDTTAYNVDALDKDGSVINTFCGVPSGQSLPPGDIYLAQKMLLETDEVEFLLKANRQMADSFAAYGGAGL